MLVFSKLGRKRIDRHRERKLNAGTELFVYLKAISARENGLSDRENVALHQILRFEVLVPDCVGLSNNCLHLLLFTHFIKLSS